MSDVVISSNMLLPVPIVSQDPGPDWASNYNACLSILDQHNHSTNSGVPISQDGINLTASGAALDSLTFNGSNAFALRSARFTPQSAALALATDIACAYVAGVDLYFNDASGNQVRLTQGGSIVGTAGSITGLPSGTASASFAGGTFTWQAATNTAANMDAGSYIYRNSTASSFGLTLNPPNAMGADYSLYLPSIPASTKIMAIDTSGNMTGAYTVDNSTIDINGSNQFEVKTGGLTAAKMAASAVTDSALNIGVLPSIAANALVFTLTDQAGSTPSATSPVKISFRNATAGVGEPTVVSVTSSITLTLPAVAGGLGFKTAVEGIGYLYAINNAGTLELAASHSLYDDGTVVSTSILTPTYISNSLIYSAAARTNVPVKLLARFKATQTGTNWTIPSEVSLWGPNVRKGPLVAHYSLTSGTLIQTSATVINFQNKVIDTYNAVTTGAGWVFTVPETGYYDVSGYLTLASLINASGLTLYLQVYVNGVSTTTTPLWQHGISGNGTIYPQCGGSAIMSLTKGDTLSFAGTWNGGAAAPSNLQNNCYVSIALRSY
jgi:hypothetical protein